MPPDAVTKERGRAARTGGSGAPLVALSRELSRAVSTLEFGAPVAAVYNPLAYAREPHERYLERYGGAGKEALLLGMNPGPFGMAQTGVPFGDVSMVKDWLGINGVVAEPRGVHAARPIEGFACRRGEVSGQRLWGLCRASFGTAERFFARFFVWNYCPLAFLEESGKNRTPDKLPKREREPLFEVCDRALLGVVRALGPARVVGVGGFAAERARHALAGEPVAVSTVLHPSPASPRANRGWAELAVAELRENGIEWPEPLANPEGLG